MDMTVSVVRSLHSRQLRAVVGAVGRRETLDHPLKTAGVRAVRWIYFFPCLQSLSSPRVKVRVAVWLCWAQTSSHQLERTKPWMMQIFSTASGEWRCPWELD